MARKSGKQRSQENYKPPLSKLHYICKEKQKKEFTLKTLDLGVVKIRT